MADSLIYTKNLSRNLHSTCFFLACFSSILERCILLRLGSEKHDCMHGVPTFKSRWDELLPQLRHAVEPFLPVLPKCDAPGQQLLWQVRHQAGSGSGYFWRALGTCGDPSAVCGDPSAVCGDPSAARS
jgi:hypothetical protein